MSTHDATSTMPGHDMDVPLAAGAIAKGHEWWRVAARPLVLATGFFVLAGISTASIFVVAGAQSNTDWVTHTLQVEIKLASLRAVLGGAESSARGYLVSRRRDYRDDFEAQLDAAGPALDALKDMTGDNPAQQQALAELSPLVVRRLDKLREIVRLADSNDMAAATAIVRDESGRALMTNIRTILATMADEEHRLLAERTARVASGNSLLVAGNLAGVILMIALAAVSILVIRRMGAEALRDSEKRAGELQAAVNELDAFSYSVSHDLRTPLRAIDGFSRILLKHHAADLAPEPREYLQAVRDNTVQMGHLVDDLLAFARLNRKQIAKRGVPLRPIVERIVDDAQKQAEGRTVRVTVGVLPTVWGDAVLLKQVFVNLIDNAFKYSRQRADATVEIGSRSIDGEDVIFVRDNGVGFDMQYIENLFGVFQRLHRAEDFEGTGVGLAIVQRIVHRHGWRIWAEAAVDQGATFYFTTEVPPHA